MPAPMHNAYQSLAPEEKRMVTLSIPLLRLADNLDRSHDQRIQSLECRLRRRRGSAAGSLQRRRRSGAVGRRTRR